MINLSKYFRPHSQAQIFQYFVPALIRLNIFHIFRLKSKFFILFKVYAVKNQVNSYLSLERKKNFQIEFYYLAFLC